MEKHRVGAKAKHRILMFGPSRLLWKIWSVGMMTFPIYGKMFQTTNQPEFDYWGKWLHRSRNPRWTPWKMIRLLDFPLRNHFDSNYFATVPHNPKVGPYITLFTTYYFYSGHILAVKISYAIHTCKLPSIHYLHDTSKTPTPPSIVAPHYLHTCRFALHASDTLPSPHPSHRGGGVCKLYLT